MNIRQAILKAADSIEERPSRFNYGSPFVPKSMDDTGCPIAWIGYFAPRKYTFFNLIPLFKPYYPDFVCRMYLSHNEDEFLEEMQLLSGDEFWRINHKSAICGLRAYAAKYYPEFERFHKGFVPADPDFNWRLPAKVTV